MPCRDLGRLERWGRVIITKVRANYKELLLCQGNPKHKYRLHREWIECRPREKDLELLVGEKPITTQQCAPAAQKANCVLDCTKSSSKEGDSASLLCPCEIPPGALHPALGPPAQGEHGPVGVSPEEAMKMTKGWSTCSRKTGWQSWDCSAWKRFWRDLKAAFQYQKGSCKRAGEGLYPWA
ncbi:hypothetical protein WISP_110811 [Willisornis vidua]|uniref:Uncharacterized protein n=1 Tax=Willisornis vidua TaxID=1566151 RepID=A0ABQ9D1S2_9PASS|nr:hypothetical protein WISP_110811 [Willisornis vidua]